MKVDRRLFLKTLAFAGGGTLGFLSSPAPWHIVRDLARWTQNWPWVPVPPHGQPAYEKAICMMCDGGCGIKVRKVGPRMVKIDGDGDHPLNRGLICPHGTAALQTVYGPSRIRQPLKRTGTRENPQWKPVSWEEAIGEVVAKIQEIRAAGESRRVVCITNDCENTANQLLERFLQAVGSRNLVRMNSGRDVRNAALKLMQGIDGDMAYDLEHAKLIASFGCSLLEGWGTWGRLYGAYARSLADDSVQIIQIEPNLSITASKATQWVPIKPGTEGALALGIAHVLVRERLYDKDFVASHSFGFDDWQDASGKEHIGFKSMVLADYAPQTVEEITAVPSKQIEKIAFAFAENMPAIAVGGKGGGELFTSVHELMAIHSLNALMGNINKTGGVFVKSEVPLAALPPTVMDEEATRGYAFERLDGAGSPEFPFTRSLPGNLKADDVRMLLVHESNPYYAMPDQSVAQELFERVPYIVTLSCCMNESAARADLILPLHTGYERWDDQLAAPDFPSPIYNLGRPMIEPLYDNKDAAEIVIAIAKALGGAIAESFPWTGMREILEMRVQGLHEAGRGMITSPDAMTLLGRGLDPEGPLSQHYPSFASLWRKLLEDRCWFDPEPEHDPIQKIFRTPSKKFEFYSQRLRNAFNFEEDAQCMPHYEDPALNKDGFDLVIMPEETLTMADDGKDTPPFLMKQLSDEVLEGNDLFVRINPITALYHNLEEGDRVILESPRGRVEVRLHLFEGVREGIVLIPLGFGHSAYDEFLRGKGVNAYEVLDARKDTITGLPVWWATPGKITKV